MNLPIMKLKMVVFVFALLVIAGLVSIYGWWSVPSSYLSSTGEQTCREFGGTVTQVVAQRLKDSPECTAQHPRQFHGGALTFVTCGAGEDLSSSYIVTSDKQTCEAFAALDRATKFALAQKWQTQGAAPKVALPK